MFVLLYVAAVRILLQKCVFDEEISALRTISFVMLDGRSLEVIQAVALELPTYEVPLPKGTHSQAHALCVSPAECSVRFCL